MPQQSGIIAFFDILGYQNFLERNDVSDAVNVVLETLSKMPEASRAHLSEISAKYDTAREVLAEIKSLIFSDTILLTSPYDPEENLGRRMMRWILFTDQVAALSRRMFDFGLPVRGAVVFGDYIVHESCFAGRPIIDAYRLTSDLDLAAVIVTQEVVEQIRAASPNKVLPGFLKQSLPEYLVPLKSKAPERFRVVNFALLPSPPFQTHEGDERKIVSECFWRHHKDIPPDAYGKLTNTEMLLRFLRSTPHAQ